MLETEFVTRRSFTSSLSYCLYLKYETKLTAHNNLLDVLCQDFRNNAAKKNDRKWHWSTFCLVCIWSLNVSCNVRSLETVGKLFWVHPLPAHV